MFWVSKPYDDNVEESLVTNWPFLFVSTGKLLGVGSVSYVDCYPDGNGYLRLEHHYLCLH